MSQNVELDVDDTDTCQANFNYRTADFYLRALWFLRSRNWPIKTESIVKYGRNCLLRDWNLFFGRKTNVFVWGDIQNAVPNDFYASGHMMYWKFRPHNANWKHVDMCKDNNLKTKKNQGKQCTEHTL